MTKALFIIVAILLFATTISAQRRDDRRSPRRPETPDQSPPRPRTRRPAPTQNDETTTAAAADFAKCGQGLTTLGPYVTLLIEEVTTNDPDVYINNIKQLYEKFRGVAADCGIPLPKNLYIGNQSQCKNDMKTLAKLFGELKNQMQKTQDQQNLIALLTIYMSLAENLPKTLEDCKVTLN